MFTFFLSWWGAFLLSALDSSPFFFLPFGNDALLIYLAARNGDRFWLYPVLATAGSVVGASVSYWLGLKIGEAGLARLVAGARLERLKKRVRKTGAFAMVVPAALPPPFPLSAFVLTCGALEISRRRLFVVFAVTRLVRFELEAYLAYRFGTGVLSVLQSPVFRLFILGLVLLAIGGTAWTGVRLWRQTRRR